MCNQAPHKSSRFARLLRTGLGLGAGVAFIILAFRTVDLIVVYRLVATASLRPLAIAGFALVADFLLRAVRFWIMLQLAADRRLPLRPMIAPFVASFGVSDVLPFRIGDGFRAYWFSRRFDIPAGTVIGTMVVERSLDLVTLVVLGGVVLALIDPTGHVGLLLSFQLILTATAAVGAALLFAPALLCRLLEAVLGRRDSVPAELLISALRRSSTAVIQIGAWRRLAWLAAMSLVLWLLESMVLIGAWVSLGGSLDSLLKPLTAFVFSTLGTLVPSLPGHFGSFEYFGIQAFALTNVEASTAAAVVLLAHLILWAPTAMFGICWLLFGSTWKAQNPA